MLTEGHLTLKLVRLKSAYEWPKSGNGLSFLFPKAGSGSYFSGKESRQISPGDVLLLNGRVPFKLSPGEGGELLFWTFSIDFEHLFPLFTHTEIPFVHEVADNLGSVRHYPASAALAAECHRLISEAPPHFDLDHRGQLLRLAAAILSKEFNTVARQRNSSYVGAEEHMAQVFEKLTANEVLNLSVEDLAQRFGCSRRHLNRLFHQHFGFSMAALKMEMRLVKAASLLRDPTLKIINVADQCGFNHLGLFNTCFNKRFGTSPGRWRKLITDGQNKQEPPGRFKASAQNCEMLAKGLCPWMGKELGTVAKPSGAPQSMRPPVLQTSGSLHVPEGFSLNHSGETNSLTPAASISEPAQNLA